MSFLDNRRNFRVSLVVPVQGKARIISVNNTDLKLDKYFPISILDFSASGMKINTPLDLPIGKDIILETTFDFNKKTLVLQGVLVWKEEKYPLKTYGTRFINLTEKAERQLVYDLNKYQLSKTKLERLNAIKESPAAKIINAIPYPSILLTAERKIIAVNNLSEKLGATPGAKCYMGIWQENKICSFCRLEDSRMYNDILSYPAYIKDKKYVMHWLCLGKKIFLHYWTRTNYLREESNFPYYSL